MSAPGWPSHVACARRVRSWRVARALRVCQRRGRGAEACAPGPGASWMSPAPARCWQRSQCRSGPTSQAVDRYWIIGRLGRHRTDSDQREAVAFEHPPGSHVPRVWVHDHAATWMVAANLVNQHGDRRRSETAPDRGRVTDRVVDPAVPGSRTDRISFRWVSVVGVPLTPSNAPSGLRSRAAAFKDRQQSRRAACWFGHQRR
jgi:hypothetical protein